MPDVTPTVTPTATPTVTPEPTPTETPIPTPTPSTPTPTPKPSQQEVIYIYVTPTPIPSDHDPYIPDVNESTVTGLENPLVFTPGKYYRFKATGASASTKYENSTIGDGKWMPAFWSFDEAGEDSDTRWKLGSDEGIEVGTHELYVWFQLYVWNGSNWGATDRIEALKTNFTSTTLDPSPAPEKPLPAVTNLKATATGLKTVTLSWTASDGADGYIILGLNSAGRTGKQIGYTGATTWVDKAADSENWNYYWVLPYRKADGKLTLGALSNYAYALGRTVGAVLVLDAQATTTGVSLSWGRADNANSYVVLSKTGSATAPFNDSISTTGTTFKDTEAKPGEVKYYWVYGSYNNSSGKPMAVGKVSPFVWAVAK